MNRQWSTSEIDFCERFDYWRDALSNAFVPLEPVPFRSQVALPCFNGAIQGIHLPSLRMSVISADGHEVSLTRSGIARQKSAPFFVNLLRRGSAHISQHGEYATAAPGDIYVVDSAAPWWVSFNEPFEMLCIEIGEDVLRPRLGALGRLPAPVLSGEGNQVLRNYLSMLREQPIEELCQLQDLIFEHCVSLVARSGAGAAGQTPAVRDSVLMRQQVLSFIDRHLTDPDLSPEAVCNSLRISRSYLFKLLANGEHSFSSYVREARMQGCRQVLLRHPNRPVSQVASSWGFNQIATFNRLYRQRFGETPSQSRGVSKRRDADSTLSDKKTLPQQGLS
ncbi:helix-turn-helix domain-containing protein [Alcaligenaceae bacterium CGII-47]|nr:helix-turn-helix domain-containing protein [Alcaligenaceae bacterium CGII-47]